MENWVASLSIYYARILKLFTEEILFMKIIVFSDSHGSYAAVQSIMDKNPDADMYIFLGDGDSEVEKMLAD